MCTLVILIAGQRRGEGSDAHCPEPAHALSECFLGAVPRAQRQHPSLLPLCAHRLGRVQYMHNIALRLLCIIGMLSDVVPLTTAGSNGWVQGLLFNLLEVRGSRHGWQCRRPGRNG